MLGGDPERGRGRATRRAAGAGATAGLCLVLAASSATGCGSSGESGARATDDAGGGGIDAQDAPAPRPDAHEAGVDAASSKDPVAVFVSHNPERCSLTVTSDDAHVAGQAEDRAMPLASTVKIVIALAYAQQVAAGTLDPATPVALDEPGRYALGFDGGAHASWLAYESQQGRVVANAVPLREVARGMMMFSSNADAEYLEDLVGLDAIDAEVAKLALWQHGKLFYLAASMLLLQNVGGAPEPQFLGSLEAMTTDEWAAGASDLHAQLKADATGALRQSLAAAPPSLERQHIWSGRLPASTTADYAAILRKLDGRSYLAAAAQDAIDYALEWPMESAANQAAYDHLGFKGGSTLWILTEATYGVPRGKGHTEIAMFCNELTAAENGELQAGLDAFNSYLFSSPGARAGLAALFP